MLLNLNQYPTEICVASIWVSLATSPKVLGWAPHIGRVIGGDITVAVIIGEDEQEVLHAVRCNRRQIPRCVGILQ